MPLDADEQELLDSVERGEWRSTRGFERQQIEYTRRAAATFRKHRRVDIRISSKDLEAIEKRARHGTRPMKIVEAERELLATMRAEAARRLGRGAREADVEALAQELYEGPKRRVSDPETPMERHLRRQTAVGTRGDLARYHRRQA